MVSVFEFAGCLECLECDLKCDPFIIRLYLLLAYVDTAYQMAQTLRLLNLMTRKLNIIICKVATRRFSTRLYICLIYVK